MLEQTDILHYCARSILWHEFEEGPHMGVMVGCENFRLKSKKLFCGNVKLSLLLWLNLVCVCVCAGLYDSVNDDPLFTDALHISHRHSILHLTGRLGVLDIRGVGEKKIYNLSTAPFIMQKHLAS